MQTAQHHDPSPQNDMQPPPVATVARTRLTKDMHLQSLQDVLEATALIDGVLQRDFGGRGRGIHSKLDSITHPIPKALDERLRYIGALRNKALAEPWYRIEDRAAYLAACEDAATALLLIRERREHLRTLKQHMLRPPRLRSFHTAMVALLVVLFTTAAAVASAWHGG